MSIASPAGTARHHLDVDPGVHALLDRKRDRVAAGGPYTPLTVEQTTQLLVDYFATVVPGASVSGVGRIGGGASKEQFFFELTDASGNRTGHILRIDPVQTASETDRRREFEALDVYRSVVPAPAPEWLDHEGAHFGQPAVIMGFVPGVTKPTAPSDDLKVTGIGTTFSGSLRESLADQYLGHLAAIHNHPVDTARLPSFEAPTADPWQPARWALNWWSRVWADDAVEAVPIAALTEEWLRRHIPASTAEPVMIHGDFRTGNFLFDESTGRITAVLDWEYVHLGDFHEDLGWMMQQLFRSVEDGEELICGLYPAATFVQRYEQLSGRTVDPETLRWYVVLNAWKCLAITLASSAKAARDAQNHQDALLAWMSPVGYHFATDLCALIEKELSA
ncbi:phosphotransferase [Nakamurella sp. YIM 132087]|uniref:Phosphotransferase n=1 Tax=Nakamurella alba TaxID=2665158 RepID=A0A7K1FEK4_9ACTN|nr:phosphotransferase family protein [Nakamurella alba]MTD12528.1 phosphotransferase [Nakamurella alba]